MNKKGFSYLEVLIGIIALSIITLSVAEFAANTFKVSYNHSQQIATADQTRFAAEAITNEINKAGYIFPANSSIALSGTNFSAITINTNNAVAVLAPSNLSASPPTYRLKVFYLLNTSGGKADLYEFIAASDYSWNSNTIPSISSSSGLSGLIANDIVTGQSTLTYSLNSANGTTDTVLKGSVSGVTASNPAALINCVNWTLVINLIQPYTINIEGISKNVPRFIEQ